MSTIHRRELIDDFGYRMHTFRELGWLYLTHFLVVPRAHDVWDIWSREASPLHLGPFILLQEDQASLLLLFGLSHLFLQGFEDDFAFSVRVQSLWQNVHFSFDLWNWRVLSLFGSALLHVVQLAIRTLLVDFEVISVVLGVGLWIEFRDVPVWSLR